MRNKISAKITGLTALAATIIATTSFAQSEPVYSVNIIGMQKQSVVEDLQMMSNPFEAMTIKELVGTSGIAGDAQDVADNVIAYDSEKQEYVIYYLRNLPEPFGLQWLGPQGLATNVIIEPGEGFFYRSRNVGSRTNVLVGDVVLSEAVTNTINSGLQILSYPYSTSVNMADMNLKNGISGDALDVADNIIAFDAASQGYVVYYLRNLPEPFGLQWLGPQGLATNVIIEAGQSFFFRSRATNQYNWVENTPYPNL